MEGIATAAQLFKAAADEQLAPVVRVNKYKESVKLWAMALRATTDPSACTSLLSNMSVAHRKIFEMPRPATADYYLDSRDRMYHFGESLSHLNQSISAARAARKPTSYTDVLLARFQDTFFSGCTTVAQEPLSAKCSLRKYCHQAPGQLVLECGLELVSVIYAHSLRAFDQQDYLETQRAINECERGLADAEIVARRNDAPLAIHARLQEMADNIYLHRCILEGRLAIATGDKMLNRALQGNESLDTEELWSAIDMYHQAAILTRSRAIETEAIAVARRGRVYAKVIRNEATARPLLRHAVVLAASLSPRSFHGVKWYDECVATLSMYQEREAAAEDRAEEKKRAEAAKAKEPVLKKLAPQLEAIKKEVAKFGPYKLLEHIYEKHPPRIPLFKKNAAKILADVKSANVDTASKVLLKAISHYHADKNLASEFGLEWSVLCEEITKMLNEKYDKVKLDHHTQV